MPIARGTGFDHPHGRLEGYGSNIEIDSSGNTIITPTSGQYTEIASGILFVNDTANTGMTTGITINQGDADNEILAFKSSDVAHGMTTHAETDTFGKISKASSTAGGLLLGGYGELVQSIVLSGSATNDDTAKTNAATAPVEVQAYKKTGTSAFGAPGTDANLFAVRAGATGITRFIIDNEGDMTMLAQANNQALAFKTLTEQTTFAEAATTDTTIQIPADSVVLAVSVRVTTIIPTAANFDVGVAGATTRYGTGILVAAGTTNPGTDDGPRYYSAATAIRFTPNLQPVGATGVVRVTIHYYEVTPPTS